MLSLCTVILVKVEPGPQFVLFYYIWVSAIQSTIVCDSMATKDLFAEKVSANLANYAICTISKDITKNRSNHPPSSGWPEFSSIMFQRFQEVLAHQALSYTIVKGWK